MCVCRFAIQARRCTLLVHSATLDGPQTRLRMFGYSMYIVFRNFVRSAKHLKHQDLGSQVECLATMCCSLSLCFTLLPFLVPLNTRLSGPFLWLFFSVILHTLKERLKKAREASYQRHLFPTTRYYEQIQTHDSTSPDIAIRSRTRAPDRPPEDGDTGRDYGVQTRHTNVVLDRHLVPMACRWCCGSLPLPPLFLRAHRYSALFPRSVCTPRVGQPRTF